MCLAKPHMNESSQSAKSRRDKNSDARLVDGFHQLEKESDSFTRSFPPYLKEPILQDGFVDWTLLNAYLAADQCVDQLSLYYVKFNSSWATAQK